jgi:hypothetical protein
MVKELQLAPATPRIFTPSVVQRKTTSILEQTPQTQLSLDVLQRFESQKKPKDFSNGSSSDSKKQSAFTPVQQQSSKDGDANN